MPQVTVHHNPFCLQQNVEIFNADIGQTIRSFLDHNNIAEFTQPTICFIDGNPVLRDNWNSTYITDNTAVAFIAIPQGGGDSGKAPIFWLQATHKAQGIEGCVY